MADIVRIIDGQPVVRHAGTMTDLRDASEVWLWDCGPEKPKPPERPEAPTGKQGDPEYDLAVIEFKEQLEDYEAALKLYAQQKKEFADWEKRFGGPVEVRFWSVDARDALKHDARAVEENRQAKPRYHISARTRGFEKTKNGGLPVGMKPGRGHQANLERQIAGEAEFVAALKADPHFGQEAKAS